METTDVRKLARVEDRHWWFRERRHLLARDLARLQPPQPRLPGEPRQLPVALDVGAAGGGNTRVAADAGWDAVALEYAHDGAVLASGRGVRAVRGDAQRLPFADGSLDVVIAFDVLEHLADDKLAAAEIARVLRPGGTALVTVPAGADLWSPHDESCGHYRRYDREMLQTVLEDAGLAVQDLRSWNVLLRPVVKLHRRRISGNDVTDVNPIVNTALGWVVAAERVLPVHRWRGVSLRARAVRPA